VIYDIEVEAVVHSGTLSPVRGILVRVGSFLLPVVLVVDLEVRGIMRKCERAWWLIIVWKLPE
jgi:hypothetical protein